MTPLLWEIVSTMKGTPPKDSFSRSVWDVLMHTNMHSFDVTAAARLVEEGTIAGENPDPEFVFLPAEGTWLERKDGNVRIAYMLAGESETHFLHGFMFFKDGNDSPRLIKLVAMNRENDFKLPEPCDWTVAMAANNKSTIDSGAVSYQEIFKLAISMKMHVRWFLSFINTPGIIGLHVHPSHKGRMKKLSGLGLGKFPLGAWTELVIGKPTIDRGGVTVESHQVDRRPLHFVRSHLKPSLANRRIPAHWRGNAAYGIRRSRYKVEPRHPPTL